MASEIKKGHLDNLLYWTILVISILGNFIISIALVPFLLTLEGWPLYFTVFFVGAVFGFFFSHILQTIEKLRGEKHIAPYILIPAVALVNIVIVALITNKLILLLDLKTVFHSPFIIGVTYVSAYISASVGKYALKKL